MNEWHGYLQVAVEAASLAGSFQRYRFGSPIDVDMKGDKDLVTEVDRESERLITEKRIPSCVVIFPDPFTRLGGSQYLNSSASGDYEDHITGELIPWARTTFHAGLSPEQTVIAGKSSGGFGAFVLVALPQALLTMHL